ncbi:MAG: patatin-like phospholipase family protein [Pseudomonadota bacterium]
MPRRRRHVKSVNLALQGGGSHGAFTWGVLDRIFEEDRIWIEAISGTSAGAMNAVVAAQGMYDGQAEGARQALHTYWAAVSAAGRASPIKRSPLDMLVGNWSLDTSPTYLFFDLMSRIASPYETNPLDLNPLRDLLDEHVDFEKVRACGDMGLYLSATNVETGRVRVFKREEITRDAVLASACLPFMFKAVEIDGEHYWDGGFMGNPVLFPFIDESPTDDIVIVQINPVLREGVPKTAREILNRVNEITFNSSLLRELRAIDFVRRLKETDHLPEGYREMRVHIIEARKRMRPLGASSKLNSEWAFLRHLFEIGREAADRWLQKNFDEIGHRSTLDVRQMFQGIGATHHG